MDCKRALGRIPFKSCQNLLLLAAIPTQSQPIAGYTFTILWSKPSLPGRVPTFLAFYVPMMFSPHVNLLFRSNLLSGLTWICAPNPDILAILLSESWQ